MKLFTKILLSFWVATVLMFACVISLNQFMPVSFPGVHGIRFEPERATPEVISALNILERQGTKAFRAQIRRSPLIQRNFLGLFDADANPLVNSYENATLYAQIARDVASSGRVQLVHFGFRVLYAFPVTSAAGKRYVAVLTISGPANRASNPRFWLFLTLGMFPAAMVSMVLTLYITRPIIRLQAAARRLAGGELTARAGPVKLRRHDELGDLARDFDAMAGQIEMLMTAQRRFVADVSHELGGPLTRLHLALALLRREYSTAQNNALARIERETDKLSNLVQQLLLLAALEAGRVPAETLAPLSIRSLCESIVDDARFEAAQVNCRIEGTREDIAILAYPKLLRRAIDNVLRNAIRYAPAGTDIELTCRVDTIRRDLIIEILDRGCGVPDAMLTDIFTPFFRTAPGRETTSGSAGLGLAIASEAVALHHGSLIARNREGGGLQVTIRLPLRTPVHEDTSEGYAKAEELKTY